MSPLVASSVASRPRNTTSVPAIACAEIVLPLMNVRTGALSITGDSATAPNEARECVVRGFVVNRLGDPPYTRRRGDSQVNKRKSRGRGRGLDAVDWKSCGGGTRP